MNSMPIDGSMNLYNTYQTTNPSADKMSETCPSAKSLRLIFLSRCSNQ